jgi:TonB-linked SusC/RagA family outer membrane protein
MKKTWIYFPISGKLKKLLLTMKLSAILSFSLIVSVNASVLDSDAQGSKLSLNFKDATLIEAMDIIEKSSDFIFVYYDNLIDVNQKVSLNVEQQSIESILDEIFASTGNTYTIIDRQIVISQKNPAEIPKESSPAIVEELQQRTISGTVTGANNEPLSGVTVIIKGTSTGTLTDVNGKFTLAIPASAKTVVFSFIGMESKEFEIGSSNVYDAVLTERMNDLSEVVVVGYGSQKKITVTGAVASVQSVDLVKSPNASVANTLAGRVTGVSTVQYTGLPGGEDPAIFIRGIGSLTSSASAPLMLVDGVERSFSQIDPNEIENISVLKDASATAVYGIRGANGVLIVTTRRGSEGAPKISFSSSVGLQHPTRKLELSDSYTYAINFNRAQLGDDPNAVPNFSQEAIEAFRTGSNPILYPSIKWADYLMKPSAFQTQSNFNVSGGSKVVKYFVSVGYLKQDGLFKNLESKYPFNWGYQRYNYRANIDIDATSTTKLSLTMGGRNELREEPTNSDYHAIYWCVPYGGQIIDGKHVKTGGDRYIYNTDVYSGIDYIGWGQGYRKKLSTIMNLDLGVSQKMDFITKGLNWRLKVSNNSSIAYNKTRSVSRPTYYPYYNCDVDGTNPTDSTIVFRKVGSDGVLDYSQSSSKARNWYLETALAYNRDFGPHNVTGLLLYNESQNPYPGGAYPDIPTGYVGLAARATYNYSMKYFLDVNLGYNGSENFAPENRFGFFPSVSAGWTVTEEKFLKNKISFLDYLKFRFSYGVVGNDRLGSNRFLYLPDSYTINAPGYGQTYPTGGYNFGTNVPTNQLGAAEAFIGNPNVTWEKARKQNYGVDLKVFKGKLGLAADYFYEYRNNILTTRSTVPNILAIALPAQNIGEVENKGFEAELKWRDGFNKFNYYLTTNVSFARNKVLYMDEVKRNEEYLQRTGKSVGVRFGYVFDGFWSEEDIKHLSDFPDHQFTPKPGDTKYKDLNNDKKITQDDHPQSVTLIILKLILVFQGALITRVLI